MRLLISLREAQAAIHSGRATPCVVVRAGQAVGRLRFALDVPRVMLLSRAVCGRWNEGPTSRSSCGLFHALCAPKPKSLSVDLC